MSTPTPEAIEAAAKALHQSRMSRPSELAWLSLDVLSRDLWIKEATAALTAAYPLMEASAKAEAWEEGCRVGKAHGYNVFTPTPCPTNPYHAATITEMRTQ